MTPDPRSPSRSARVSDPADTPDPRSPDPFLHQLFGPLAWLCSHPVPQHNRRTIFQALSLLPLGIVVLLGLWLALDIDNWLGMMGRAGLWLTAISGGLAFALGALLTLSLVARTAELQSSGGSDAQEGSAPVSGRIYPRSTRGEQALERVLIVTALALGFLGPVLAFSLREAGRWNGVRFACHLFALFPLVGLLVAMQYIGRGRTHGTDTPKRRPIWLILASLTLALLVLTLLHDLAFTVQNSELTRLLSPLVPAWYRDLGQPLLGVLLLAPVGYALLAIWRLFPAYPSAVKRSRPDGTPETGEPADSEPVWQAIWNWIKRLFVPEGAQQPPQDQDRWPAWLDDLLEDLPPGCRLAPAIVTRSLIEAPNTEPRSVSEPPARLGPVRLRTIGGAAISDASELAPLFGGVIPTTDQVALFRRFRDSYQEVIREGWEAGGRRAREPSADLLVEGDPGSGRTTTLIACAIYAALGRGQRVLLVVPNAQRERIVQKRIVAALTAMHLHHYLHAEIITGPAVARWLAPGLDQPAVVPQILLGTLDAVETHLYGAAVASDDHSDRLRRLLMLLEVVLVDDFMDFDDAQRSHLPLLLDKQRLLLEADFMPLQAVVVCPQLAPIGRVTLGTRLYTERLLQLDRNVLRLRPRQSGPAWRVDLEADAPRETVDQLVVWCLRHGLDVVLYRRGIDESERLRQESDLRDKAGGEPRLAVLSDLDQSFGFAAEQVEAVFYQVAAHQDICVALRLHVGGADSVIFSVRPTDEVRDAPVDGIVPVVAARSAQPLLIAHLQSVARWLRRETPISQTAWSQFGIAFDGLPPAFPAPAPQLRLRHDAWEHGEPAYHTALWPYAIVQRSQRLAARPVDTFTLPDETFSLVQHRHQPEYFIARVESSVSGVAARPPGTRYAQWYTSAGQSLDRRTDLAHARELRLSHGTEAFVPQPDMRPFGEHCRLTTQHWRGDGGDAYLPVYTLVWHLEDAVFIPQGGGPAHGLQWFHLQTPGDEPVLVEATIERLMNEYGVETPIQRIQFTYPARLSGLLLAPSEIDGDLATALTRTFAGQWGTAGSFAWSPVLTGAINYALHARLPGLSYFAPTLTFWLDAEQPPLCDAVTWIIEPTDVGRTVLPVLGRLLSDSRECPSFFRSVHWYLTRLAHVPNPQRFQRRFARQGYHGDQATDRLAESRQLIGNILGQQASPTG